jgi:hypothetical protein
LLSALMGYDPNRAFAPDVVAGVGAPSELDLTVPPADAAAAARWAAPVAFTPADAMVGGAGGGGGGGGAEGADGARNDIEVPCEGNRWQGQYGGGR